MSNYITDDIDTFSDDADRKKSDYSDEKNYNEFKWYAQAGTRNLFLSLEIKVNLSISCYFWEVRSAE